MFERPVCEVGDVIDGRYRIDGICATGGMGTVLRATHLLLARRVAMKVVSAEAKSLPGVNERFLREARLATQLESPHIARVLDVGLLDEGSPFLVMEWLEGRDLADVVFDPEPLPVHVAVSYALQICEALDEVHAHGIVHRDLKPANLFLVAGQDGRACVKLIDFGISKVDVRKNPTCGSWPEDEGVIGSPTYMAPEQINEPEEIDARADIWALGVVLFELLTKRLPFGTGSLPEILGRIYRTKPCDARDIRSCIPAGLARVIGRCLEVDPTRRYASAAALAKALAPFSHSTAKREEPWPRFELDSLPPLVVDELVSPPKGPPTERREKVSVRATDLVDPTTAPRAHRVARSFTLAACCALVVVLSLLVSRRPAGNALASSEDACDAGAADGSVAPDATVPLTVTLR